MRLRLSFHALLKSKKSPKITCTVNLPINLNFTIFIAYCDIIEASHLGKLELILRMECIYSGFEW